MSTFVLVHGVSHGGWAWGLLARRLERAELRRFLALRMPCTYIRRLRDQAVTPARAAEYARRSRRSWSSYE